MKTPTKAVLLLALSQASHHVNAFSAPAQLSVGPRAISLTGPGIQFARTKSIHGSSYTGLRMSAPAAAAESTDDPLFEGFGKGIARDYKARLPLYKSDITDGLNPQVRT